MAGPEISQAARRCYDSLSSLAQEFETSRHTWEHELTERDFAQLFERFEQWAGNLGALRQPSYKLSLDHRLRDSPTVRASIFSMLEDLNESAKMEIVSGRRPNRVMPTLDITEEELEEFDISSSSSESGASTTSNSTRDSRNDKPSEIQKLLSAIRTSLNSLFKASVFIRKFAPEDRRQRASKTKPFVNTADLIRDAHLRAEPKPIDGEPLPQGSIVSAMTKPSILAETEATEFVRNKATETQFFAHSSPEPAMSVFSMATTVVEASDTELVFPPIPEEGQRSDSFVCPYCLEIVLWQTKNKEAQWRQVYIALSVDIIADVQNSEDMQQHMHNYHKSDVVASQLSSLISQCKRPARQILASDCPFCDDEWAIVECHAESSTQTDIEDQIEIADVYVDAASFRKHVGHHLVQLSLFSLPRLYSGEVGDLYSAGAVPDGERYSQEGAPFRLGQDHFSRGWQVLIKRMGTLMAISLFLGFHHKQRRGNVYPDELAFVTFESLPPSHKDKGEYWFLVHNPTIPKMFDVSLLHTGEFESPIVDVIDIESKIVAQTLVGHANGVSKLDISKDGVAFSNQNDFLVVSTMKKFAQVWKTHTEELFGETVGEAQTKSNNWTCNGHLDGIEAVRFSSDDKYVITASLDKTAKVFPAVSQQGDDSPKPLKCLNTLEGHSDCVLNVEVMSNGWAMTSSMDRSVRFWDIETGKSIARLVAHTMMVSSTAVGPSMGTDFMFATAGTDHRWRLWSLSLTRPDDLMPSE
ncbi:WD domain-containing protein [Colletotrichum simmondsii]|uniref:WD domain-containing protein n=1 Tax=Colletotrichum simmondsii TaxID=703756 RepID=A0A135TAB7_9PEZI|nr:WD domain-containing protein [Colletotrichum simmondsii]